MSLRPDENGLAGRIWIVSWAWFGPRAVVWRPLL